MSCMNVAPTVSTAELSSSRDSNDNDTDALKLLRRLQQAILTGQPQTAANVASELAKMRANCSMAMRRSEIQLVDENVAKEPIRVQVQATTTISDLEMQIYQKHKVPIRGRCVVLLETTVPYENENDTDNNGAEIVDAGDVGNGNVSEVQENKITNGIEKKGTDDKMEWTCSACTFINESINNNCSICYTRRSSKTEANSAEVEIIPVAGPSSEALQETFPIEEVYSNYQELLDMEQTDLITNLDAFECPICMCIYHPGDGVVLKTCLHSFCRDCLRQLIETSADAEIRCPYIEDYSCDKFLQDREIRALVSPEIYDRYLQMCVNQAESKMANTFHCKTTDCTGWCVFEKNVNVFNCPVCFKSNCLACQAIHIGLNCAQYQRKIQIESENDPEARKSLKQLESMLQKGEAMNCPTCQIIILKRNGCDAICCTMCKTLICWVTKGPRWGPKGYGDISGGCRCSFEKKCHPQCMNCH